MTKTRSTKKSLVMSVLSLLLCVTMLVGTTFAWFTDSVTSENNIIKSGNLDIELQYAKFNEDGTFNGWADVEKASDILTNTLWEPGVTEVAYLRVANAGSLALKYQLGINIVEEKAGVNVAGKSFKLSDYIYFGVVEDVNGKTGAYANRDDAVADVADAKVLNAGYTKASTMATEEELYLALVVYMPTEVGNEANHNGTDVPEINLGINVFATQTEAEEDSFGNDYDANAPWTGMVDVDWYLDNPDATEFVLNSAEELAGLAAIVNGTATAPVATYAAGEATTIKDNFKGKTIKLGADIDLNEIAWTPIGDNSNPFLGNFDGQGNTVSNLYVSNDGWAGLIGHAGLGSAVTISNVTIDGATILSNRMAGAVVGQIYGSIDNCHVKDAVIQVTPNKVGDSYDNGDKVGGIVGWLGDNDNNRTLSNCTAENVELGAYRDVGGIVGYVASSTTVKDNSVSGVKITVDQTTNYYGDKDVNAGYICGRVNGTIIEANNTKDEASVVKSTYSKNGLTMKADGDGKVALYLVPETYEGDTVTVPEGVTAIGNYAFAYNDNVETVVLPSTVTDLGRGFDSSTVKKVVLNEGLTTISSRAFRSTTALEEVVISSTVTEIADNAFQKSAIKEIVIPATVETIGETAFGASLIEKVTFEGNTAIQGYAFRGCTKLRTVVLKGDDVTFVASALNGRNSCWFCNGESNNPNTSNITFYVKNDTVAARVKTAMGAEASNTPVYIGTLVSDAAQLKAALTETKNIILDADIVATEAIVLSEGVTVNGNNHSITYGIEDDYHLVKLYTNATLKNVTLNNYRVRTESDTNGTVTIENVVVNMDNDQTGIDISRGAGTAKLTNVKCASITDEAHLDSSTQVQVDYTPYGDVLLGGAWALEATGCEFGSLHGWNTRNGSSVSLNNTTTIVFRMHYWSGRTLYINGVETAWAESGAIPVAHDVGGCWSVQPAFK